MYIKKSVLILGALVLILATILGTSIVMDPFGGGDADDLGKLKAVVNILDETFYEDVDKSVLADGALRGIAASLGDPYTVYMNKEEAESFMESVESDDYTGVGLYISTDEEGEGVVVISPLSGSPAEKAGLSSGDKILAVDGVSVAGENIDKVASIMKGPEGTEVSLSVLKKASGKIEEVKLNRATIRRETVASEMIDGGVGYIQITQFGVNTYEEFVSHFNDLAGNGMDSLVIDLRNNPGGYMEIAVQIADTFVDEGEIVYTLNKKGEKRVFSATKGKTNVPMAVIVNGGSASASEVLVGALRDHGLAKIVGEKTFGKGVTQIPISFKDGSMLKITESRYYTPKGVCIDHEGIMPDEVVVMSQEEYASALSGGKDSQLQRAIEILGK